MPRTKDENEKIKEQAKNNIVDKAIEVFAKKGFSGTNMQDIADCSEISIGLVYRSKDELFAFIINFAIVGLKELSNRFLTEASPKETLLGIAQELINELDNEVFINLNMMVIQGLMSKNNSIYQELLEHDREMFSNLANLIKKGQELREFGPGDPNMKSCCFFSQIQGLVMMKSMFKNEFKKPSVNDITALLFINMEGK